MRYKLNNYALQDNITGHDYYTRVSLADCTIPFEELLNKQDKLINKYQELYHITKHELDEEKRKNKEHIDNMERLESFMMDEYDIDLREILDLILTDEPMEY